MSDNINAGEQGQAAQDPAQRQQDLALVYAAMMEELGNSRMDSLPLEDGRSSGRDRHQAPPAGMHSTLFQDTSSMDPETRAWHEFHGDADDGMNKLQAEANGQLYRFRHLQAEKAKQEENTGQIPLSKLKKFNESLTKAGSKSRGPPHGGRAGRGPSSRGGHSSSSVRTPMEIVGHHLGSQVSSPQGGFRGSSRGRGGSRGGGKTRTREVEEAISRLSKHKPGGGPVVGRKAPPNYVPNDVAAAKTHISSYTLDTNAFLAATGLSTPAVNASTTTTHTPAVDSGAPVQGSASRPGSSITLVKPTYGPDLSNKSSTSGQPVSAQSNIRPASKPTQGLASSRYADPPLTTSIAESTNISAVVHAVPALLPQGPSISSVAPSTPHSSSSSFTYPPVDSSDVFRHEVKLTKNGVAFESKGFFKLLKVEGQVYLTLQLEHNKETVFNKVMSPDVLFLPTAPASEFMLLQDNAAPAEKWKIQFRIPLLAAQAEQRVYASRQHKDDDLFAEQPEELVAISKDESQSAPPRGKSWNDMNSIGSGPPLIEVSEDDQGTASTVVNDTDHSNQLAVSQDIRQMLFTKELLEIILDKVNQGGRSFMNQVDLLVAADPEASKNPELKAKYNRVLTNSLQSSIWSTEKPSTLKQSAASEALIKHYVTEDTSTILNMVRTLDPANFDADLSKAVFDYAQSIEKPKATARVQKDMNWDEFIAGISKKDVGNADKGRVSENTQTSAKIIAERSQVLKDAEAPAMATESLSADLQPSAADPRRTYSSKELLGLRLMASPMEEVLPQPVTRARPVVPARSNQPSSIATTAKVTRNGVPIVVGVEGKAPKSTSGGTSTSRNPEHQAMTKHHAIGLVNKQPTSTTVHTEKRSSDSGNDTALENALFAALGVDPGTKSEDPEKQDTVSSSQPIANVPQGASPEKPSLDTDVKPNIGKLRRDSQETIKPSTVMPQNAEVSKSTAGRSGTHMEALQEGRGRVSSVSSKASFVTASGGDVEEDAQVKAKEAKSKEIETSLQPVTTYLYDEDTGAKIKKAIKDEQVVPPNKGLKASRWATEGSNTTSMKEPSPRPHRGSSVTSSSHQSNSYFGSSHSYNPISPPTGDSTSVYQTVLVPDGFGNFVQVQAFVPANQPVFTPSPVTFQENMSPAGAGNVPYPQVPTNPVASSTVFKASDYPSFQPDQGPAPRLALSPKRTNAQPVLQARLNQSLGHRRGGSGNGSGTSQK